MDEKFVEVDGQKFVDDGTGSPKLDDAGQPVPFKEPAVPYHRFKEVNDKVKDLEQKITGLQQKKQEGGLSEEQEKELQAKQYLKTLLKETLTEEEKAAEAAEAAELQDFKTQVNEELELNPEVKKADFLTFLEKEGDDYATVDAAMRGYKRVAEAEKSGKEKAKENLSQKPGMLKSEGTGGATPNYAEADKGKSLWQIAQEAIQNAKK